MSKDQQPSNSENGGQEDEHFVIKPDTSEQAESETGSAGEYQPKQFDLSALPDDETLASNAPSGSAASSDALPLGFVSEPRPASRKPLERPSQKPQVDRAAPDETPPLGFVSQPRPAASQPGTQSANLGFVSEPRPAAQPATESVSQQPATDTPAPAPARTERPVPQEPAPQPAQPEVAASEVVLLEVAIPETVAPEAAAAEMAVADEPAAGEAQTPGQILKQARQRRGLSVEDVVDATRMNAETILALEADRDPEQSAWVYVRGFYRRYAKALKIPEEPLLDAHARMHGDARPAAQPVADEWAPQDVSASPSLWPKMIFVLLAGICLGTTVWFLQPKLSGYVEKADIKEKASNAYGGIKNAAVAAKDKAVAAKDKSVAAMGSAAETVKHQSAELAEVANQQYSKAAEKVKTEASPLIEAARAQRESMQKATATEAQSNSEAAAEPQSQTAAAVVQAQPAAAQPEPEVAEPSATEQAMLEPETTGPAGPAESGESAGAASSTLLEMQFSRQTWLSVSDGNGLVLFEDMVEGDTQKRFDAEPPITLFLGTATAAEVWFNGQPVNIASQMRSNGTARLVLGE